MNGKVLWITRTAVFIALLIVMQAATSSLGQYVTGSIVNLILIVSVMTCGYLSGIAVAIVSPIFAKLLGIGPLWSLIPFIALGNIAIVLIWRFVGTLGVFGNKTVARICAMIAGAVGKFVVLYVGIVIIAIPIVLSLPQPQAAVMSGMFSFPQLITAGIGGALAVIILPLVFQRSKD